MFMFLSHPLDPNDVAWSGEPTVKVTRCTDITEDCPFSSFISEIPNHCGTHMDAPRHFVKNGLSINELSMDYFCHKQVALLEIPKDEGGRALPVQILNLMPKSYPKCHSPFYARDLKNIAQKTPHFTKTKGLLHRHQCGAIFIRSLPEPQRRWH